MRKEVLMLVLLAIGFVALEVRAQYQPTVGCYAKGGLEVAGVCIDRRVVIR